MTTLRVLVARLGALVGRGRSDAALDDDVEAHLELLTRDFQDRGLSARDAQAAARRAFGGVAQMKETYRDQRGLPRIETFVQDLRYAARMLRRDPAFAAVAILSLAIGIGASTAGFSLFNAVMLRPLPVPEPDRLVLLQPQRRGERFILFNPIYEELRARQTTLSGVFAANDTPYLRVIFEGEPAPAYLRASLVSGSYFDVLGLAPHLGRLLTEQDDQVPAARPDDRCAAVISYRLWNRRFAESPAALGRTLRVGTRTCAIVGIAPATFDGHQAGVASDVWLPLRQLTDPKLLASRGMAFFSGVMGRVAPGIDVAQAEAELTSLYQQAQAADASTPAAAGQPQTMPADFRIRLAAGAPGFDAVRRSFSGLLTAIMAVVGVVLLIASVNVANLLLARGAARLPELATRAALGAGRWRLVRQLATEGLLLAVIGGLLGVGLAWMAIPVLASQISLGYMPVLVDAHPDLRVLGFAVALTATTALVAGVLPALRLSRTTLQSGLASGSRTTVASSHRLQRTLVTAQLAMAVLLVTAAGLLLRTIVHLAGVDPGFTPAHVVMLSVRDEAPKPSFGDVDDAAAKAQRAERYRLLDERLNSLPGVQAASVSWLGLFSNQDLWLGLIDPDRPGNDRPNARVDYVSVRYFDAIGMQLVRGRGFHDTDREGAPRVAVVNETLARARFGAEDPLGRRIALDYRGEQQRPFTVVGIVRDSKYNDLKDRRPNPMIWIPIAQSPFPISSISLRTAPGAEASVTRRAEEAVRAVDPDIMVRSTTTLSAQVAGKASRERLLLGLSSGFATVALVLAAVGLYGTLAYMVSRRTREIGVRLAFGARRDTILRMVVGDALRLAAVALVVGIPLSLAVGYSLRTFLFGVTPADPATLAGACLVLTVAAVLAAYLPARRAAAVDPIAALRCD
jgi:predicted permease